MDTQLHPKMEFKNQNQSIGANVKNMTPQQGQKYLGHTKRMNEQI